MFFSENLNVEIVRRGLALPAPFDLDLSQHREYPKFYHRLLKAEDYASGKRLGLWKDKEPKKKQGTHLNFWSRLRRRIFG